MAVPVEDGQGDVFGSAALALADLANHFADRLVEAEQVRELGGAGQLLHVDAGAGIEHRAALGQGDHREGATETAGGQGRSFERVDRDVDHRRAAVADLLAVVEHRRFVLLAFADDHDAVHRNGVEQDAHGIDRGAVGGELVTPSDPPGEAARAADSVTRTSSRARLRSGFDPDRTSCEITLMAGRL